MGGASIGRSSKVKKLNLYEKCTKAILSPTRHEVDAHNNAKLSRLRPDIQPLRHAQRRPLTPNVQKLGRFSD
jgi:hypothetical protein